MCCSRQRLLSTGDLTDGIRAREMTGASLGKVTGSGGMVCGGGTWSGRHYRQHVRRPAGIGSDLGPLLMKGVVAVLIKIQRQVH